MLNLTHLAELARIEHHHLRRLISGYERLGTTAERICEGALARCWNGRYLQTSAGHFRGFYTRDFGWTAPSLLRLGRRAWVVRSLAYALERFERAARVHVAITPRGRAFDFPDRTAPDSLAYLLHTLAEAGEHRLVRRHRALLTHEAERFAREVVDHDGLPHPSHFSSMKDHAIRTRSCYDAVMCAVVQRSLTRLRLANPLRGHDYPALLRRHYWSGTYFLDDLSGDRRVTGDANLYPFWLGIITDERMLRAAFASIHAEGLDEPLPLRYSAERAGRMIWVERFVPNWEGSAIWTHMGPAYIETLKRIEPRRAKRYLEGYLQMVERLGTYPEVLDGRLRPYRSALYSADAPMSWCAALLCAIRDR